MPHNNRFFIFINHIIFTTRSITKFAIIHIFDVVIGPLVVVGSILCLIVFYPWPLKFACIAIWLTFLYFLSKAIDKLNRKK